MSGLVDMIRLRKWDSAIRDSTRVRSLRGLGRLIPERSLIYVTGGNLVSTGLAGVFWFLLARLIEVEAYGRISYLVALGYLIAVVSSLGLGTAVTTFRAKGDEEFTRDANSLTLLLGLVSGFIISLVRLDLGLFVLGAIFYEMSLSNLLGERKYRLFSVVLIGARVLQIGVPLALFFLIREPGILLGYAIALLAFSVTFLLALRGFRLGFRSLINHGGFVLNTYAANTLRVASIFLDKIIVGPIFGYAVLGVYTISSQFLLLFATIPIALFQYLLPENSAGQNTSKISSYGILSAILLTVVGILTSPIMIMTFFPNFAASIPLAQVMMLALVPITYTSTKRAQLLAENKSKHFLVGMLIFVSTLILGMTILGFSLGPVGLAIGVTIAFTVEALFLFLITRFS